MGFLFSKIESMKRNLLLIFLVIVIAVIAIVILKKPTKKAEEGHNIANGKEVDSTWRAPDIATDLREKGKEREMILYGHDLIAHTAKFLGPKGTVAHISNGMNCQNCHLDAGTRPWGNNYAAVYATYPQLRGRSNTVQNIYGRINDCLQRSLNGKTLDTTSYEIQSIYMYMKWLGKGVAKGKKPYSAGLPKPAFLSRAADPAKGKVVYIKVCSSCHGDKGQGLLNADGSEYTYPPLWGQHSYNDGAGLHRLSSFASFVSSNMPYNLASHAHPLLKNEEAWDVAAYVNSQPRPRMDQHKDWPDITKKPFDAPYGPYADSFNEQQHKYGPFEPIVNAKTTKNNLK